MRARAACICSPQSQRWEWKTSPVRHSEWTRTRTGSPDATSPSVSATCSASVFPKRARYPWTANSPYSVGSFALATRSTSCSRAMRYAMRSFTVTTLKECFFAKRLSSGIRDIEPSGLVISQMTPTGCRPARRQRSTAASV